jgi:DNA-directed RNA polymerase specialized sigma24 family protein
MNQAIIKIITAQQDKAFDLFHQGLSIGEIAKRMRIPIDMVNPLVERARSTREEIRRRCLIGVSH